MTPLRRHSAILLLSCSAFIVTSLGDFRSSGADGVSFVTSAHAKSDKAGGNGGGNGKDKDKDRGNSSSAKDKSKGNSGNSASARNSSGGNGNAGNGVGGLLRGIFGGKPDNSTRTASVSPTKGKPAAKPANAGRKPVASELPELAELPVPGARPNALPKPRNLNAKLAGLNSLNRNFHAYLNSSDPRMTAVRDYVLASVDHENTAAELEGAKETLAGAKAAFDLALNNAMSEITGYSPSEGTSFSYDGLTPEELAAREGELSGVLSSLSGSISEYEGREAELAAQLSTLDPTSADYAVVETELSVVRSMLADARTDSSAIQDELEALASVLSDPATAEYETASAAVTGLEESLETLAGKITEEELVAALLAASNRNRVAEFGEDAYIDDDILAWAKNLLGVDSEGTEGEDPVAVDGVIDEIRAYLAAQAEATDDPAIADEPLPLEES